MNFNKVLYYLSTGIVSFILSFGAFNYLANHEMIQGAFTSLGFPLWLIYPMAISKILGVLALWITVIPKWLREWAYAGIFFNCLLAFGAHMAVGDNSYLFSAIALFAVVVSRFTLFKLEEGKAA